MKTIAIFLVASLLSFSGFATASDVPTSPGLIHPLLIGTTIPSVKLRLMTGQPTSLRDQLSKKPAVIIFYRGGWCPYCNLHLADLRTIEHDLKDLGYQIIAISPDRPEELGATIKKHDLGYTLLSDSTTEAARGFGIAFKVDAQELEKYKSFGHDIEKSSGEKHHYLPVPSVFLVDENGVIQFEYVNPNYKIRLKSKVILSAAQAIIEDQKMNLKSKANKENQ